MRDFVLVFRGGDLIHDRLPDAEIQRVMDKWRAWTRGLEQAGMLRAGNPLELDGRVVAPDGVVSDGPFAESKEVVGGYIVIRAATLDAATEAARACPGLPTGMTVEVRPVK